MRTALDWAPRVLAIAFSLFVSLFALDSFSDEVGVPRQFAQFAVHLIPGAVCLVILALSWRREWLGAVLFAALGVLYVVTAGRQRMEWILVIAGPLFLLAALYLAGWLLRERLR